MLFDPHREPLRQHIGRLVRTVMATAETPVDRLEFLRACIGEDRLAAARTLHRLGTIENVGTFVDVDVLPEKVRVRVRWNMSDGLYWFATDSYRAVVARELDTLSGPHQRFIRRRQQTAANIQRRAKAFHRVLECCGHVGHWCSIAGPAYMELLPPALDSLRNASDWKVYTRPSKVVMEGVRDQKIDLRLFYAHLAVALTGSMQAKQRVPDIDFQPLCYW